MSKFPLWLRVLLAAMLALPLLVVVVAFVPALVVAILFGKERRDWVLEVLDRLGNWYGAIFSGKDEGDDTKDGDA
ncbi:hypothetical protein ACFQVD_35000 [Streptosporangium amethystogenes subsp. fukuiense]|uniref:Uncharacterized protein n=1 Tax=Streptosporangium amethystogenes subsp. fukuiense TaxID=698418 RepID=A0ABW2TB64_9ACTN